MPKPAGFSLTNFEGKSFPLVIFFGALSLLCLLLAFLQPELLREVYRTNAIKSAARFELTDEISAGSFKETDRIGDTNPSFIATFYGINILNHQHPLKIKNLNSTIYSVQRALETEFNHDMEHLYYGIYLMHDLKINFPRDQYYQIILHLNEPHSGFRLNSKKSASVRATAYAFEIIRQLGKMDEFLLTEEFNSTIQFVASMKDPASNGFRDTAADPPTLLSSWFAVQVLQQALNQQAELAHNSLEGIEGFVLSCQAHDGGFLPLPVQSAEHLYFTATLTSSTCQALWILKFMQKLREETISLERYTGPIFRAYNYLRSCFSFSGVLSSYGGPVSLEATWFFLKLVDDFPSVIYGIPPQTFGILITLSGIFLILALFNLYRNQFPEQAVQQITQESTRAFCFLALGALSLQIYPPFAIVIYLVFAFYLSIQAFELFRSSNYNFDLLSVAFTVSSIFALPIFGLVQWAPFVTSQLSFFFVAVGWMALSIFVGTIGAVHFKIKAAALLTMSAAFQSWAMNLFVQYSFLYGRGDMALINRVLYTQHQFPIVFVLLPFASLCFSYLFTVLPLWLGIIESDGTVSTKKKMIQKSKSKNK